MRDPPGPLYLPVLGLVDPAVPLLVRKDVELR